MRDDPDFTALPRRDLEAYIFFWVAVCEGNGKREARVAVGEREGQDLNKIGRARQDRCYCSRLLGQDSDFNFEIENHSNEIEIFSPKSLCRTPFFLFSSSPSSKRSVRRSSDGMNA